MQGHQDVPLSPIGHAQAKSSALSVAALEPEIIVSSDLQRASATAEYVAQELNLSVTLDSRLRETELGDWEGLTRDEVMQQWPDEWTNWRSTTAAAAPPGGESRWQVAKRAAPVVAELDEKQCRSALLVSHAGTIIGLTGILLGLPDAQWSSLLAVGNCHWAVLRRSFGGWRLHTYNAGLGTLVLADPGDDIPGA